MKFIAFVLFVLVVILVVRFRKAIWGDLTAFYHWVVSLFKRKEKSGK